MTTQRKRYRAQFKAPVTLEALKGNPTINTINEINEIARE